MLKISKAESVLLLCNLANRVFEELQIEKIDLCEGAQEHLVNGLETELNDFFEVYIDREYP